MYYVDIYIGKYIIISQQKDTTMAKYDLESNQYIKWGHRTCIVQETEYKNLGEGKRVLKGMVVIDLLTQERITYCTPTAIVAYDPEEPNAPYDYYLLEGKDIVRFLMTIKTIQSNSLRDLEIVIERNRELLNY